MHIDFKKLVLHNFISFGHSELIFADDGFIKVSGRNENPLDLAISNGSGKSSLWEGIIWALTGDTIRGTKKVSNLYGDDGTYVKLEFILDSVEYSILRSKDHKEYKTSLLITVDGKDCSGKGLRDSEKLLSQYLPDITASLLGSVIILGQGLPQKFTNNTPSGRKEVLEKLSKSDFMIEDLKTRVTNRRNELNKIIRELEDSIISLNTTKNHLVQQLETSQSALSSLDSTSLSNQLADVQEDLSSQQVNKSRAEERIEYYQTANNNINQQLITMIGNLNDALRSVESGYEDELTSLEHTATRLSVECTAKAREITQIENIKDTCPTCKQRLPDVHKPSTDTLKQQLEKLRMEKSEVDTQLQQLQRKRDAELLHIKNEYAQEKEHLTQQLTQLNSQISECKISVRNIDQKIQSLLLKQSELQQLLTELETRIKNYQEIILKNQEEIHKLENMLLYNNNEKDLQQSRLEVVNKFDTVLKRDFRGYLLSTIIDYIQLRAKAYSSTIFENDNIGFSLDGNNIDITYQDKAYENLSGGEKQKIDLIIQFSLRDMLSNHLGFTSNILVLDEVFDALDAVGCQRVLDVISSLSDIKNIFIVTHRNDLSIPCDKELIVVKSISGISEIQ